ncbi:hypothetical protein EI546_12810 [Aequorivita sp. H23M31]|uniref:Lipoprotein n=1 Tax=Aequorivita ciconiae TaxID=2494375 RepID=A0A410G5S6_9FLAO|nr:hypothetical protein [Aequorivita sp. H23M31]QAA82545.1 hypothetical protein EI546_12810 [Aequorivita sp. H23M31]
MTKVISIFLLAAALLISCKETNSKSDKSELPSQKTERIIISDSEEDTSSEMKALLDRLENYILTDYLTERDLRVIPKDQRKIQLYQIDLNSDGRKEILLNFITSYFCGSGGCNMVLLNDELQPITEFTVMQTPIYVEDTFKNGWKVLKVHSEGKWRELEYKNGSYPSNPSVVAGSADSPSKTATILFDNENSEVKTYSF